MLAYRGDVSPDVESRIYSYNANFTSTSGNFIAQFGAHYLQLMDRPDETLGHGAGASGIGLFSLPMTRRFDNGVPIAAFDLYVGIAPTATISGERNFFSAPVPIGLGVSVSPGAWITMTPWFEVAPSANLDTYIDPSRVVIEPEVTVDEAGNIIVNTPDVAQAVGQAIDTRFSFRVPMRAGFELLTHLGETWDIRVGLSTTTLGSAFQGSQVLWMGGGLAFRWDDVAPAILPARRRLSHESCEAIEERFMMCPQVKQWRRAPSHAPGPPPSPGVAPPSPVAPSPSPPSPVAPPAPQPAVPPPPAPQPAVPPPPAPQPPGASLPEAEPEPPPTDPLRGSPYGEPPPPPTRGFP